MYAPSPFQSPRAAGPAPDFGKNLSPIKWADDSVAPVAVTPPRAGGGTPPSPRHHAGSPSGVTSAVPSPAWVPTIGSSVGRGLPRTPTPTSRSPGSLGPPSPPSISRVKFSRPLSAAPSASLAGVTIPYGEAQWTRTAVAAHAAPTRWFESTPARADACVQTEEEGGGWSARGDAMFEFDEDTGRRLAPEERISRIRLFLRLHPPPPLFASYQ